LMGTEGIGTWGVAVVCAALTRAVPAGAAVGAVGIGGAGLAVGARLAAVLAPVFAFEVGGGTGNERSRGVFVFAAVTEACDLSNRVLRVVGRETSVVKCKIRCAFSPQISSRKTKI